MDSTETTNAAEGSFQLVHEGTTSPPPHPERVLGSLARVLDAASGPDALGSGLAAAAGAWIGPGGWVAGLAISRSPDGAPRVLSCVSSEKAAEALSAELEPDRLARLLEPGTSVERPIEDLGEAAAEAAEALGVETVDLYPVEAAGRVVATIVLLGAADEPPSPPVRTAMRLAALGLSHVAARQRAEAAVSAAARHIQKASSNRSDPSDASPPAEAPDTARERAQAMERRYALLLRGAEPGLWDWDLEQDRMFFSPRWKAALGFAAHDLENTPQEWFERIHPEDQDRVELELLQHLDGEAPRFESEHRLLHADGTYRWFRVRGIAERSGDGGASRMAGSLTDVTELRERDRRTARELMYNGLTRLPTSTLFLDRVGQAMRRRARRPDRSFAVLAISFDALRDAAEKGGSTAREEALLTVTQRLQNATRPGDSVAHLDEAFEFGVLLDDVKDLDDAVRIAERMVGLAGRPMTVAGDQASYSGAVGLALSRTAYEAEDEILRDAIIALRRARREDAGIQVFDAATRAFAESMSQLEGELRAALESDQLFLEYQPIVALDDGRITGMEAFLRWRHPERGLVPPAEFIPVAEHAGLLAGIGDRVLRLAGRQMREWIERFQLRFPPSIAVNVGESQLFDESFVTRTLEAIEESGIDPKLVRLDVSEGAFTRDGQLAGQVLRSLASRGVRIAVDDFGTGYSSLTYLHRYPISALKIDRSFVSGGAEPGGEWGVARTIVELSRILDVEVIAEGIETREQFQRLRELGCQQAQGFYFSGPVPAGRAGRLIKEGYPIELAATRD